MRRRFLCNTLVVLLTLPACSGGDFSVSATDRDDAIAPQVDATGDGPSAESGLPATDALADDAILASDASDVLVALDASPVDAAPLLRALSRGMPAKQSTTYADGLGTYVATRGNDGDLADYQATTSEPRPWWRVDLGAPRTIVRVDVHNRKSRACPGVPECARVGKLDLEVSDDDVTYVLAGQLPGIALYPTSVAIGGAGAPGVSARYVRVRSQQTNFLDMGEVEVWGY